MTCQLKEITVKKSRNSDFDAKLSLLASWIAEKEKEVGCYYGSLVNAILTKRWHKMKKCKEDLVQVTADTFWKWLNVLMREVIGKDGIEPNMCIVLASFCSMRYINVVWYFLGDDSLGTERLKTEGKTTCNVFAK